jgi:hypothetical protein
MRIASALLCVLSLFLGIASAQVTVRIQQAPNLEHITGEEAIERALKQNSLTTHGSPFHAILDVGEPDNSNSRYRASIEVYWQDGAHYRVATKSDAYSQTRIVNKNQVEEHVSGDFYPDWLRNFVTALLNPLPHSKDVLMRPSLVVVGNPAFQSCLERDDRINGITDQMTWAKVCFNGMAQIVSSEDFTYTMRFTDYQTFEKKSIARTYTTKTPEEGKLVGRLIVLEAWKPVDATLLKVQSPTLQNQQASTDFVSTATNASLIEKTPTIDWPSIPEGKTDGYMIIRVITDRTGQVREAYKFSSDTSIVDNIGRTEALKYKFKPLIVDGVAQQMETPLVIHFTTRIENPYPIVSGVDIEKYVTGCGYNPVLPAGLLPSGTTFTFRITVNEAGKITLEESLPGIPWGTLEKSGFNANKCKFEPYLVNGTPSYHKIDFVFTAP